MSQNFIQLELCGAPAVTMELQTVSGPSAAPTADTGEPSVRQQWWSRQERYAHERRQLEGEMHSLNRQEARYRLELDDAVTASKALGEELDTLESRLRERVEELSAANLAMSSGGGALGGGADSPEVKRSEEELVTFKEMLPEARRAFELAWSNKCREPAFVDQLHDDNLGGKAEHVSVICPVEGGRSALTLTQPHPSLTRTLPLTPSPRSSA